LENRRSKNDEVSRKIWKAVETEAKKIRMGKTKGGKEEIRREGAEKGSRKEEEEKKENNGNQENSREIGNIGQRGGSGKVRGRSKKTGTRIFP